MRLPSGGRGKEAHTRYSCCFGFGFEFAADFPFSKCEAFWKSRVARLPRRPRPRSQAVLGGHNALERAVEYHGDQRIQIAKLNLTVPAPCDLDAEVSITSSTAFASPTDTAACHAG